MSSPLAVRHPTQADSPPREPGSDQIMAEAPDSPPNDNTNQVSTSSGSQANGGGGDNASKAAHSSAGSSWNNKKFQEEYQRAESQLTDQNWDHRKYGDPLMQ